MTALKMLDRMESSCGSTKSQQEGREGQTRCGPLSVSSLVQVLRSRERKGRCTLSSRVRRGRRCVRCCGLRIHG